MAQTLKSAPAQRHPVDWLDKERTRLPSWLLSALFHGMFLACLIVISQSKGCQPGYPGAGGDSFRQVGVYLISGDTEDDPPPNESPETSDTAAEAPPPTAEFAESPLLDGPPVDLNLPDRNSEPILGLGAPPTLSSGGAPAPSLGTDAILGPPPSTGTALGGATSLFGITDAGRRFLYVFDRSGSMGDHGAIRVAKAELMASLENLDATQQFQVIFYNREPFALTPRDARSEMFRGTATHRLEVQRQIDTVTPDGGTQHQKAIEMALDLNPDVIFFLTDAAEPPLRSDELADIKRRNNGGARIHCIEFGEGPSLQSARGPKNFLQKLAEQNGGQYQYRDVRRFR